MRKFISAAVLALTVLVGISLSTADAQVWRRGYNYPRTYYNQPYYNYANVAPSTTYYTPGYSYQSNYYTPATVLPYYNRVPSSGYFSNYGTSSYYYSTPYYAPSRWGWRRW